MRERLSEQKFNDLVMITSLITVVMIGLIVFASLS